MKLAINITLSLLMLGGCVWLVWPDEDAQNKLWAAFNGLEAGKFWPYLAGFLGLLAVTHFCRAWRWNNLLAPIGVQLSPLRLLAISSVGFMAILALPARLGEFVRPALIRKKGEVSAAAALGTIVVERVVDGLMVSLFVAGAVFALDGSPHAQTWMWWAAYISLGVFTTALSFLVFALRWPDRTVRFAVRATFTRHYAPKVAAFLEDKLHMLISGFVVLKNRRSLMKFVMWSLLYWGANGMSLYVLAEGFDLGLSLLGAYTVMGLVAVGIILPNAPALTGQFQLFTTLGLSLYLGEEIAQGQGLAFAIVLWGLQVIWYIGVGTIALASPYVSVSEVMRSRSLDGDAPAQQQTPSA